MEIYPANIAFQLIKTNIVESLEAGAGNSPDTVIRDQEVFLPPHKDMLALIQIFVRKVRLLHLLRQWTPCGESRPVVHIRFIRCTPCLVACLESVLVANDFAFEERRKSRVVFCKSCRNAKTRESDKLYRRERGNLSTTYLGYGDSHKDRILPCPRA